MRAIAQGNQVLEETFEMVRVLAAERLDAPDTETESNLQPAKN
jgi:hypothetical protein